MLQAPAELFFRVPGSVKKADSSRAGEDWMVQALSMTSGNRTATPVQFVSPVEHPGWDALLAGWPQSNIFHTAGWAQVLQSTYGHRLCYLARIENGGLAQLLPMAEVRGIGTGVRGLALPFSDLCDPLCSAGTDIQEMFQMAVEQGRQRGWRYLELRGSGYGSVANGPSVRFFGHSIDLEDGPDAILERFSPAVRRSTRKAQHAGLVVKICQSEEAVEEYYQLHCMTRQRHGVPPQPYRFFQNLAKFIVSPGNGFVTTARLGNRLIASAVFLHRGAQAIYKFGASDHQFQALRANNLVMWSAYQHCMSLGIKRVHLGRTSLFHEGLRRFKLGLGAREEYINYYRFDFSKNDFVSTTDRVGGWFTHVFRHLPLPLLRLAGRLLYPQLS